MINRLTVACLALFVVLYGSALAAGPAELMIYGGPTVSSYTGGYDLGASAMIDLPMMPKVGVEAERSAFAGNVNITRVGLVYEQTIIPFLSSIKISAGTSSLSYAGSVSVGSYSFSGSGTENGSYVAAGIVVKLLSLILSPKFVYNQYGGTAVSEGMINAGMAF